MARIKESKLNLMKLEARKLYCDATQRLPISKISKAIGVAEVHLFKWKREEDWDDIRKRIDDGIRERLKQDGIRDGYLDTKKLLDMQKDLVQEGKKRHCFTKDSAYRAAASLETLIMKKNAIQANPEKALSILDVLNDDSEA